MNPFEKIFNYQIISRLEDSGTFMATSHERAWLKAMLAHPAAEEAFAPETLTKLRLILEADAAMEPAGHLIEKARTAERQVYHPLLRSLRRHILNKQGIRITYRLRAGNIQEEQLGVPYKLEYSMVKREWYLLWHHMRRKAFMRTKLKTVLAVSAEAIRPAEADRILRNVSRLLDSRKTEVLLEVVREYNTELSRILYALSSFEKDVEYETEQEQYTIRVYVPGDESEYLLSKIRFLGKRVRVVEGDYLKKRMLEAAMKALARYGVAPTDEEPPL
ncbi:WYL domain-containing protein [Paenibacillus hodogayensis]|uniref:WYL domain-containing protein n=1 Tax=Paenibacillus hodogayensis TaxID=279208 RepID=A0ABV5W070_9BACL